MADRHNRDLDRKPAPLPEPLPVPCVDVHAHMEIVTDAAADSDAVGQVIADAASVGINRIVQVGYSAEQSQWCVDAAEKWNTSVLAAVALHPNEAPVVADLDADLAIIEKLAQHPRVRAIGETGLDYFRTPPSHDDVLSILQEVGAPETTIFHCYSGDAAMAKICIERGYILSFAGTITFKNAPELREAVKLVPIDQLMAETDSPFLSPMPNRGALNVPAQVATVIRAMAAERGEDLAEFANALSANAERAFGKFN